MFNINTGRKFFQLIVFIIILKKIREEYDFFFS